MVTMVTIANDPAVNNQAALGVEQSWSAHAGDRVGAYQFPANLRLGHDLIDPLQPYQRVELVYPVLADMMLTAHRGSRCRPRSDLVGQPPVELELALLADAVVLELEHVVEIAGQAEVDPAQQRHAALRHRFGRVVQPERWRVHVRREEVQAEAGAEVRLPPLA